MQRRCISKTGQQQCCLSCAASLRGRNARGKNHRTDCCELHQAVQGVHTKLTRYFTSYQPPTHQQRIRNGRTVSRPQVPLLWQSLSEEIKRESNMASMASTFGATRLVHGSERYSTHPAEPRSCRDEESAPCRRRRAAAKPPAAQASRTPRP